MTGEDRCTHVLTHGSVGETMEDETPSQVCLRPAAWRISRPLVRPKFRCDEHVAPFRDLDFEDIAIERIQP